MPIFNGTPGDDVLVGTPDADELNGFEGNDDLIGQAGDDVLNGGDGIDFLSGGAGADTINGGAGDDTATGGTENDTIDLGDGNDVGIGGAGNDTLIGGAGNDFLYGESTTETLNGVTGNDIMIAGDGDDFLRPGLGDDYVDGGAGNDRVTYYAVQGAVTVDLRIQGTAQNTGAGGMDTLVGIENLSGTTFADVLIGNNVANWIWSHGGADDIRGNAGDDTFWIPQGDGASVRGGQGVDVISFRGRVDDTGTDVAGITFTLASQGVAQDIGRGLVTVYSMEGAEGSEFDDVITGNGGDNLLSGFAGADTVNGGGGDDLIYGDLPIRDVGETDVDFFDPTFIQGNDILNGGGGDDAIYGNGGNDTIDGGNGDDTIVGGAGADRTIGGAGADTFVFESASDSTGVNFDTVVGANFNNRDVFDVPIAVTSFATFAGGSLDAASFDADLTAAMSGVLTAGRAILFTATSGSYAGQRFVVVDQDGVAGYTAGADLVFLLESPTQLAQLGIDDFI
jgi:Ca2+-binding RTX toxin-like protein